MTRTAEDLDVVLISDIADCATLLHDTMLRANVNGVVRRLPADKRTIDFVRRSGPYQHQAPPDLYLFDYAIPDAKATSLVREVAFCPKKPDVPVILLVSPTSQAMLDAGEIDDGKSVMLSPTSLPAFIRKLRIGRRKLFFRALRTLYEFGPILVNTPATALRQQQRQQKLAMTA